MALPEARGNVLVIEDDVACGQLLTEIVSSAGFGVRFVQSRDHAVAALRNNLYDYLIVDIAMSGMSLDKFVKNCVALRQKVILISAVTDPAVEAKRVGVEHWMRKPFDPGALVKMLRGFSKPAPAAD